jgi:hypothetical protein
MGELIFGLVLLAAGTLSAFLTQRADRRRLQLMEAVSPNADHPGVINVIKYAKTSRLLYIVLCLVIGLGFLVFGILNLLS